MQDVMEKDVSFGAESGGELQCIEKVDVKVRNIVDSELDMIATLIDSLNQSYLRERILHIDNGRKDFVLTVRSCELAPLKDTLRVLLKVVRSERISLDT